MTTSNPQKSDETKSNPPIKIQGGAIRWFSPVNRRGI